MISWRKSEVFERYGIAIQSFSQNKPDCLELWIGDALVILETSKDWYKGYKITEKDNVGVFPKRFIKLQECYQEKNSSYFKIMPKQDLLIQEINVSLKEWCEKWEGLYKGNLIKDFHTIKNIMHILLDYRKQLLSGNLTMDETKEIKQMIIAKIDFGNAILGLDMIVRDSDGNIMEPHKQSLMTIFQMHLEAAENTKKEMKNFNKNLAPEYDGVFGQLTPFNPQIPTLGAKYLARLSRANQDSGFTDDVAIDGLTSLNLIVEIINFACDKLTSSADIICSLFDPKENQFFTENLHILWKCANTVSKITSPVEKHKPLAAKSDPVGFPSSDGAPLAKALFVDLGRKDAQRCKVFLVCQVVRVGTMEAREAEGKRYTTGLRRPHGVAALDITEYFQSTNLDGLVKKHFVPFLQCQERESLDFTIRKAISSREINHKGQGFWVSLQLTPSTALDVINEGFKSGTRLDDGHVIKVQKMSFPDIIMPGDFRNDIYVTLLQGDFIRGLCGKVLDKNIEITVTLHDKQGKIIDDVFCMGPGQSSAASFHRSVVYYHDDKPKWFENFKVAIPIEIFHDCHIRFTFKHRCSLEGKDKHEKAFGLAFLKLVEDSLQTTVKDGIHDLLVYKVDAKKFDSTEAKYLGLLFLTSHAKSITGQPIVVNKDKELFDFNSSLADNISYNAPSDFGSLKINRHLKSKFSPKTKLDQSIGNRRSTDDFSIFATAEWAKIGLSPSIKDTFTIKTTLCSTKLTQNEDLLGLLSWKSNPSGRELKDILGRITQVKGEEIVKYLPDALDALFAILTRDQGNQSPLIAELEGEAHYDTVRSEAKKYPENQGELGKNLSLTENREVSLTDSLAFDALVFIIGLVTDRKYQFFKSVLDVYIKENFSSTLVHGKLLQILTAYVKSCTARFRSIINGEREDFNVELATPSNFGSTTSMNVISSPNANRPASNNSTCTGRFMSLRRRVHRISKEQTPPSRPNSSSNATNLQGNLAHESTPLAQDTSLRSSVGVGEDMSSFNSASSHNALLNVMKSLEYITRFSVRSYLLYSAIHPDPKVATAFRTEIYDLLDGLAGFMDIQTDINVPDHSASNHISNGSFYKHEPESRDVLGDAFGSEAEVCTIGNGFDVKEEGEGTILRRQCSEPSKLTTATTELKELEGHQERALALGKASLIQAAILKYLPSAIGEMTVICQECRGSQELCVHLLPILTTLPPDKLIRHRLECLWELLTRTTLCTDIGARDLLLEGEIIPFLSVLLAKPTYEDPCPDAFKSYSDPLLKVLSALVQLFYTEGGTRVCTAMVVPKLNHVESLLRLLIKRVVQGVESSVTAVKNHYIAILITILHGIDEEIYEKVVQFYLTSLQGGDEDVKSCDQISRLLNLADFVGELMTLCQWLINALASKECGDELGTTSIVPEDWLLLASLYLKTLFQTATRCGAILREQFARPPTNLQLSELLYEFYQDDNNDITTISEHELRLYEAQFFEVWYKPLWDRWFTMAFELVAHPRLQVGRFSSSKRLKIITYTALRGRPRPSEEFDRDLRLLACTEISELWSALDRPGKYTHFGTTLLPILVRVIIHVNQTTVRNRLFPLLYDLLHQDLIETGHCGPRYLQAAFLDALEVTFESMITSSSSHFNDPITLLESFRQGLSNQHQNPELNDFFTTVDAVVCNFLEYYTALKRACGTDDSRDEMLYVDENCRRILVKLADFYQTINRPDCYARYLGLLADSHIGDGDYVEAGLVLKLKADLLQWPDTNLNPSDIKDNFDDLALLEQKTEFYELAVDYLTRGCLWENAIDLCRELIQVHERLKPWEYVRLSVWHNTISALYTAVQAQVRPQIEYYRVAFVGLAYASPYNVNKSYIYRGKPYERLGDFVARMQKLFPEAKLLTSSDLHIPTNLAKSQEQYLQINKVTAISNDLSSMEELLISESIISYFKNSDVQSFVYTRPILKDNTSGEKSSKMGDPDFSRMQVEKTFLYTSHSFPGILSSLPITKTERVILSPLENAIESMEETNSKVKCAIKNELLTTLPPASNLLGKSDKDSVQLNPVPPNSSSSINALSLLLNGIVDPAVMGGITNYEKAFINETYLREHPDDFELVERLKSLIVSQIPLLEMGVVIHGIKSHESLKLFHQRMEECFLKHKRHISETFANVRYPRDGTTAAMRSLLLHQYSQESTSPRASSISHSAFVMNSNNCTSPTRNLDSGFWSNPGGQTTSPWSHRSLVERTVSLNPHHDTHKLTEMGLPRQKSLLASHVSTPSSSIVKSSPSSRNTRAGYKTRKDSWHKVMRYRLVSDLKIAVGGSSTGPIEGRPSNNQPSEWYDDNGADCDEFCNDKVLRLPYTQRTSKSSLTALISSGKPLRPSRQDRHPLSLPVEQNVSSHTSQLPQYASYPICHLDSIARTPAIIDDSLTPVNPSPPPIPSKQPVVVANDLIDSLPKTIDNGTNNDRLIDIEISDQDSKSQVDQNVLTCPEMPMEESLEGEVILPNLRVFSKDDLSATELNFNRSSIIALDELSQTDRPGVADLKRIFSRHL